MEFRASKLEGVFEIIPKKIGDERGYFLELFKISPFKQHSIPAEFLQDNLSFSVSGVLRGLHFQREPHAQAKLVHIIKGKAIDVVVDIRPNSSTFGQHEKFLLSDQTHNMVFIPSGFAHGFVTLEDTYFSYKCSKEYHKNSESGILWNDSFLNIDWQVKNPIISPKDQELLHWEQFLQTL